MTAPLFTPFILRNLTLRNRIGVSPMCQYSSTDGFATDWHLVHIGARATGGAGLIIMEATAVSPEGRITPGCLGIWKDEHVPMLKRTVDFAKSQGAAIGIQIGHAGRKASCALPTAGGHKLPGKDGGWETIAPSAIPFRAEEPAPREMTPDDIARVKGDFVAGAKRAVEAGFDVIELHAAHGYLLHSFLSPLSNKREDKYGQDRRLLLMEIAEAVRAAIPDNIVLGTRLSAIDWLEGGLTIEDSIETAKQLKTRGVDFIDCSSGAILPGEKIAVGPGYQVQFAKAIREKAGIPAAAVGMITDAAQANAIVEKGEADLVFLAREMLRDPYFPLRAAKELEQKGPVPRQYTFAW